MVTKEEIEKAGFTVLPIGGWIRIDPEIIPHDWDDICKDFNIDPNCRSVILCIAGVKEENDDGES